MPDLVYIADDEPNIRKLAALALKDSGFETQEFADGVSLMLSECGSPTPLCWIG